MKLNKEDVVRCFKLRMDGHGMESIAEEMPFSSNSVAKIIRREQGFGEDAKVDAAMVTGAQAMKNATIRRTRKLSPRTVSGNGDVPSEDTPTVSKAEALAAYTVAVDATWQAEKVCRGLGVNADTLEMLRLAVREDTQ